MLGLDASLTSTGYAYVVDNQLMTGRITTAELRGPHRLHYVRHKLEAILDLCQPSLVAWEDYAMGFGGKKSPGKVFHIGELGGVIKHLIWDRGIELLPVPPASMKSIIAENGKAEKNDIRLALQNRFGFYVQQNDEADAVGLMLVGEMKCGIRMPPPHTSKGPDRFKTVREAETIKGRLQSISKPK